VYPTEKSYVEAFESLVKKIPLEGLLVLSAKVYHDHAQFLKLTEAKTVTYGRTEDNDYQYYDVEQNKDGITFKIKYKDLIFTLESSSLGDYMADNMTGCFAMAHQLGIAPKKITDAFSEFKNIRRRLEKHYSNGITIFDDIAHSPKKAEAVLRSLRNIYTGKIIAVFEPNTGNRQSESIPGYDNAFKDADIVLIPRLTKIKQDPDKPEALEGLNLSNVISKTHRNTHYIEDDEKLIHYIKTIVKEGDVVIFLGSHGFRGMIEELVKSLKG
jgi:UDP-N-acetylmuramate-alanine ligase